MAGLYVFGTLIIAGVVALIVYKARATRADDALLRGRADTIEAERIKQADRVAVRARAKEEDTPKVHGEVK